jgi:hypothetical protein
MSARTLIALGMLAAALAAAGCGARPLTTEAVEERYLGAGYSNRMFDYGTYLYGRGRFAAAHAAYLAAEQSAYTAEMRSAARIRRVYLERLMEALAAGQEPPLPPFYAPPPPAEPPEGQRPPAGGAAPAAEPPPEAEVLPAPPQSEDQAARNQ